MCSSVAIFWGKMYRFLVSLITLVVCIHGGFSATIPSEITTEDIKYNLIGYGSESIEGLTPPLLEAENHFRLESANPASGTGYSPYIVEIHRYYLDIKTTGFPSEKINLNETETKGIQKLSLSFVQLLNSSKLSSAGQESETETPDWRELNPVIILTNSGISVQFLSESKPDPNATEIPPEHKRILWDFLTKYARNIFEAKLKELKLSEKFAEVFDSPLEERHPFAFQDFLDFLESVMKFSVNYAETAFEGWTTSQPETTAPEVEKKIRSSTATLFAYEEPSPFHEFPSQEFQYRRKDIDSIFYGRGVI